MKKISLIISGLLVIGLITFHFIFTSFAVPYKLIAVTQDVNSWSEFSSLDQSQKKDTIRIRIGFVGDIMAHLTQVNAQKQDDSTYDFNNNYRWVSPLFHANNIMIGNLETTFSGAEKGYSSYPQFNTPDALAEALQNAGFNIISTANNHLYDQGADGLLRTIDILRNHKLRVTGSRKTVDEKRYLIYESHGIKIGVISYTYESGREDGLLTINGIRVNKETEPLMNSYDTANIQQAVDRFRTDLNEMRNDSAEFLVTVIHWGSEYKILPNDYQIALADSLNKLGVDIIFGSHPHVVQPIDIIFDSVHHHTTFVAYSAGNFISNQRFETLNNYYTEDGLFIEVLLEKINESPLRISKIKLNPTWVNKYQIEGRNHYEVVPIQQISNDEKAKSQFSEDQLKRIESSLQRTLNTLFVYKRPVFDQYLITK